MKKCFVILFGLLLFNNVIFSSLIDTGFIKWKQPNGVEFKARLWGDEFFYWMQTNNGYMIVDSPEGWYYYAMLDEDGEYTATTSRVGVDKAPAISKELKRTSKRITKINEEIELVNNQRSEKRKSIISSAMGDGTTKKLGVVLIDFPTKRRDSSANDNNGYYKAEFENMIFSNGSYFGTTPHPENEDVFGSLRDYYAEMSVNSYQITGKNNQPHIVNPQDPNNPNLPEWLVLDYEMSYYESLETWGINGFLQVIYNEAVATYGSTEMGSYDVICFIYGGGVRTGGNFRPKTRLEKYCMGEYEYGSFAHIGTHAHEYAHAALGAHDEFEGDPDINPKNYSLMSAGMYNGPLYHSSCPAPLSPNYRIDYGWINPIVIIPDVTNKPIYYSSPTPNYYKVNIPASEEYFILEIRQGTGFDEYTPRKDGLNVNGGVLIWHIDPTDLFDYVEVEYADNVDGFQNEADRFPHPLITSVQDFNNTTSPSSNLRNGSYSSISINNIDWVGPQSSSYATVDVIDLPPSVPTGFTLSGSFGQNPTLSWNENGELDLSGYKLYQSSNGSAYSLLTTLSKYTTSFTDNGTIIGDISDPSVCYNLIAYDLAGGESNPSIPRCTRASGISKQSITVSEPEAPREYLLFDAFPNPFNPTTKIKFVIPENTHVKVSVYNMLGEEVAVLTDSQLVQGVYEVNFDASKLTSGTYIYKIQTNNFTDVKKMMLIK